MVSFCLVSTSYFHSSATTCREDTYTKHPTVVTWNYSFKENTKCVFHSVHIKMRVIKCNTFCS